jgi:hypothetical protein
VVVLFRCLRAQLLVVHSGVIELIEILILFPYTAKREDQRADFYILFYFCFVLFFFAGKRELF